MKRIYLAAPYSDPSAEVREQRFLKVSRQANIIMSEGNLVYSPISHGHALGIFGNLPTDFVFWKNHCLSFLKLWAEELHILTLPGWELSFGVSVEIYEAESLCLPIQYLELAEII